MARRPPRPLPLQNSHRVGYSKLASRASWGIHGAHANFKGKRSTTNALAQYRSAA